LSKLVSRKSPKSASRRSRNYVVEEEKEEETVEPEQDVDVVPKSKSKSKSSLLSRVRKSFATPRSGRSGRKSSKAAVLEDEADPFGVENVLVAPTGGDLITFTPSPTPTKASRSKRKSVLSSLASSTPQNAPAAVSIQNPTVSNLAASGTPRRSTRLSLLL
jgi:hypothetical protein